MAVGDVVGGFVYVLPIQAVSPVEIGYLGGGFQVDVVGLLVVMFQLNVQIAAACPEPGARVIRGESEQGDAGLHRRFWFVLFFEAPAFDRLAFDRDRRAVGQRYAHLFIRDLLYGAGQSIAVVHPEDIGQRHRAEQQREQEPEAVSHGKSFMNTGLPLAADGAWNAVLIVQHGGHLVTVDLGRCDKGLDLG